MTHWSFILRNLGFHWRAHLALLLGAAMASAVLTGALVVGDSMRASLQHLALARVGRIEASLSVPDRFVRSELADDLAVDLGAFAAAVLDLPGRASVADPAGRSAPVRVLGVDGNFGLLGSDDPAADCPPPPGEVALSAAVAAALGASTGDTVVLRISKPELIPGETTFGRAAASRASGRLRVAAVLGDDAFARYSLTSDPEPPPNVFVPLAWLQQEAGLTGRVNVVLTAGIGSRRVTPELADAALHRLLRLSDIGARLVPLPGPEERVELRSERIFLDRELVRAADSCWPGAIGVFTYFVNEVRAGVRATPYSMVSAFAPLRARPGLRDPARRDPLSSLVGDLTNDDAIVLTDWLAEDLHARPGDAVDLAYYTLSPAQQLVEQTRRFTVMRTLPLDYIPYGHTLAPNLPGMEDAASCRDWNSAVPVDFSRIRPKDEEFWNAHRGTPKAFVSLAAARRAWSNRHGELTAIRTLADRESRDQTEQRLLDELVPADLGLRFAPVRERALAASRGAVDFGQLFIGFSLFLMAAALLLLGLLTAFAIAQRRTESGILRGIGFTRRGLVGLYRVEFAAVAALGCAAGAAAGTAYARLLLLGLARWWGGAIGSTPIRFEASPGSLVAGAAAALAMSLVTMSLAMRRQSHQPPRALLQSAGDDPPSASATAAGARLAAVSSAGAGVILLVARLRAERPAVAFFLAGALLLVAALAALHAVLARPPSEAGLRRRWQLAARNAVRRRRRSMAVAAMLACGVFVVVAISSQQPPAERLDDPRSGSGGFAFLAELSAPLVRDLRDPAARTAYGLEDAVLDGVDVVPLRVRNGDDASCLTLSRAQLPRLLGVDPDRLARRGAFSFVRHEGPPSRDAPPWWVLDTPGGEIPVVGDEATVTWGLHLKLGDTLAYPNESGQPATLRIAGILRNSVLQGSLIVSDASFRSLFPSEPGHRMLMVAAPPARQATVRDALRRAFDDDGIRIIGTADRLAALASVEHTYLSIFGALGALGLLLGTLGLGLVVLRNGLERRAELALLRATGYRRRTLVALVVAEHAGLLAAGLAAGAVAAGLAVLPAARGTPWAATGLVVASLFASGLACVLVAAAWALRGDPLAALRNE